MQSSKTPPIILAFVADLYFSVRIEKAVEGLDFNFMQIEQPDQIAPFDPAAPQKQLAEHLQGQTGVLTEKVSHWRPALIIFDLNFTNIPWEKWIAVLKSAPATRRIPVIAFGSHMDVSIMKTAKSSGADAVLARSRFVSELPDLIQKYARVPDYEAIQEACKHSLSDLALEGIRLFNLGDYFEAHEILEEAWNEDDSLAKELYRAILQVSVAYLQIQRGNYRGAVKMFLRLRQWIEPLPDRCRGIDVARLRVDAQKVEETLLALGIDKIDTFDQKLFKPVQFI